MAVVLFQQQVMVERVADHVVVADARHLVAHVVDVVQATLADLSPLGLRQRLAVQPAQEATGHRRLAEAGGTQNLGGIAQATAALVQPPLRRHQDIDVVEAIAQVLQAQAVVYLGGDEAALRTPMDEVAEFLAGVLPCAHDPPVGLRAECLPVLAATDVVTRIGFLVGSLHPRQTRAEFRLGEGDPTYHRVLLEVVEDFFLQCR
nr:hypothetical protein [Stenotrophomonas indicatrix]